MAISIKNRPFFHRRVFAPQLKGLPLELGTGAWDQKSRKKFDDIFSRLDHTIHECDRGMDGQTPAEDKDRAYALRRAIKKTIHFSLKICVHHTTVYNM